MLLVYALILLLTPILWVCLFLLLLGCFLVFGTIVDKSCKPKAVMPTAAWSAKCAPPTKTLVQRQASNGNKTPTTKPISPPRSKVINGKSKSISDSSSQAPARTPPKNGSASNNPAAAEKGHVVPRIVAAEMKTTVRKCPSDSSRSSSVNVLTSICSDGPSGVNSSSNKKELTRCSSTEGVLERRGYPVRPNSRQNTPQPTSRYGKSELKRCFSSEGILERKGMGPKNLSLSRKSSGENISTVSDTSKSYGGRCTPNHRKTSLPSSCRFNKTIIKNSITPVPKDSKGKPKIISSGLKSTIEIPGNVSEADNCPETKSIIEISGNENKEDEIPPEIPPLPSLESIGIPSKNLSTIIAVDFVTNHEDMRTSPPPAHASSTIQVVQDSNEQPLSSTIIAVNYDVSTEVNKPEPPSHSAAQIFNGKSSVWSRLQSKSQAQPSPPSTNVAVNINIKQEVDEVANHWNRYPPLPPPPVPPLPSSLIGSDYDSKDLQETRSRSPPPPVLPRRKNRISGTQEAASAQGSKIPLKIPVPLTSLSDADCHVLVSEGDRTRESNVEEDSENKKKNDWDALFKKYEALEKECDSSSTTESEGIEMQHSSLTTIDSSEEDKKSCTEMLVTPLESSEDEKSCKNLILTSVESTEELNKLSTKVIVTSDYGDELSDGPATPTCSNGNHSDHSRFSTSSFESIADSIGETVLADMPLIQPVTSVSIQQCETLYKAKVAKVLADEPQTKKRQETEREITEEIFDVSLLCKKHLEKIEKSSVKAPGSGFKIEIKDMNSDAKKRDCSPVILKKCEQWSIEKEKVLVSQRPPVPSESVSRNPQFALTIAKFEQQKQFLEKEGQKIFNDKKTEKVMFETQDITAKPKCAVNLFDTMKEKHLRSSSDNLLLQSNRSIPYQTPVRLYDCVPESTPSETLKDSTKMNIKDVKPMFEHNIPEYSRESKIEHFVKSMNYPSIIDDFPFEVKEEKKPLVLDSLEKKYVEKHMFGSSSGNISKEHCTDNKSVSCFQTTCESTGSKLSDSCSKFQNFKPLPLIPSVPVAAPRKLLASPNIGVNKESLSNINTIAKIDDCSVVNCVRKENSVSSRLSGQDIERLSLVNNIPKNIISENETDIKVWPKLREQYINAVDKTKFLKPSISSKSTENLNKIRAMELNQTKSVEENPQSISKFEQQRSKFENKDNTCTVSKEPKKFADSSKVSSIINNFNQNRHDVQDKNKKTKVLEGISERSQTPFSSKGNCFDKETIARKLSSSISKFEQVKTEDKPLQQENDVSKIKYPKTLQTSCCSVLDEKSVDGKIFPSLSKPIQGDVDSKLPYGLIHLYHAGGYWTNSLTKNVYNNYCEDNYFVKRGLYAVQPDLDHSQYIYHAGLSRSVSLDDDCGIGVVRANTGRQLSESRYRTELEIFFRSGVLAQLEAQRDERLTDHVVQLQAHCRGFLARKKLAKIKIQDLAVRCIQRNVRKFLLVREWPWWRLLVRVVPLLNVHRTEEQLRQKTEELEALRSKVETLEQERTHLKHDNDKLEAKLSEMTADLAEEHSTATLATERLEVETSERLRLEKELQDVQGQNKNLSQQGERLEMELLCLRAADMNGVLGSEEDDEEGEGDSGVYKQRYERAMRELEFTRRRLQQQHEDDLEQLVALKKQLEKKLADAYEEVEEQRQVVAQWKRKVQKLTADHNDLHLLLEEQNSRNNLLEKKQRKFDSELQLLQDELRQERQQHERASREKEMALAEKYTLEQNISGIRLELELKEDRVNSLTQELDELMFGGKTEEEFAHLKKAKNDLEKKLKEQEEELDDLAGQVQLLEQSKLRLEMSLEQQRKEARRELSQRDEELEDVRCNAQKKVKALEAQLENEHEERTQLVRERHELERRLAVLEEQQRSARVTDEDTLVRLRRDLRRTKALLRDAQTMLERARGESPGKVVVRQLRNQLEDTEVARAAAVKARQAAEGELAETQAQLEEVQRARQDAEERASAAARERSELQSQLEENEEELAEVLKKYRAAVQQLSVDQMALQEQAGHVAELESERASLREQLAELGSRLENMETLGDPSSSLAQKRLELRAKELESKLELEQTTRSRLEVQITRLKEAVEKLQDEVSALRAKEQAAQDAARRLQRQVREAREAQTAAAAREAEAAHRRRELEKRLEAAEAEAAGARGDLRLALARIEDLQTAMQGELDEDSSASDPDRTESDHDSDGSDESITTFLANHKVRVNSSSPRSARSSLELDVSSRSLEVPAKKTAESAGKESFA